MGPATRFPEQFAKPSSRPRDRVINGSRLHRFLDERRERGRLRGNNDRNDREREDARHERRAHDLREEDQKTIKDYLQVLATDRDSISTQLQGLDLQDGDYRSD